MTRTLNDIIRPGQSLRDLTPDQQAEISALFENYEPTEADRQRPVPPAIALSVVALRRRAALDAVAEVDVELAAAVRDARATKMSWEHIGRWLDISGEAARLRYKDLVA